MLLATEKQERGGKNKHSLSRLEPAYSLVPTLKIISLASLEETEMETGMLTEV